MRTCQTENHATTRDPTSPLTGGLGIPYGVFQSGSHGGINGGDVGGGREPPTRPRNEGLLVFAFFFSAEIQYREEMRYAAITYICVDV